MRRNSAVVRVPSSSANLGPGFDTFSLALIEPNLTVEAEVLGGGRGVEIRTSGRYADSISTDPVENALGIASTNLMRERGIECTVRFTVRADIPVRKGLGSSGAEAVAGVKCLDALFDLNLSSEELIMYSSVAEPNRHLDNVAASALGGLIIVQRGRSGPNVRRYDPPKDLAFVVIVPSVKKASTGDARSAIRRPIDLESYVEGISRASSVAVGLITGDLRLAFENAPFDPVVERFRAEAGVYGAGYSWRDLYEEKERLLERYGVAMTVSGAGPSRLLWYEVSSNEGQRGERPIDRAIEEVSEGLRSRGHAVEEIIFTAPSPSGVEVISSS
ncbi:MAG: hypothetical protein RMJ06_01650 [Nitrososphaerota archaeon]|nr:hypothetical protein [Nitrososphaerota archaeon]